MCGRFAQTNIIKATSDIVKTIIGKVENIDNFNIIYHHSDSVKYLKNITNKKY